LDTRDGPQKRIPPTNFRNPRRRALKNSRRLNPVGVDRWPFELALKYKMRDGFLCPVGGRWAIGFWSPTVLASSFDQEAHGLLVMASTAAAVRLERVVGEDPERVGSLHRLTARELSVLRHAADGKSLAEIAKALSLGEETVRSHFKKARQSSAPAIAHTKWSRRCASC
jgi:LuxR family quorum sensing-dependent transcriptional regulator